MSDVARLDFTGSPPGYVLASSNYAHRPGHDPALDEQNLSAAWAKYKAEHDPPGMRVVLGVGVWGFDVQQRIGLWPVNVRDPLWREAKARGAAWRWYEARVELYNILRKLNPPREFWPLILTWSDQQWIEVHTFIVEHADVIMSGAADGLTFPTVLRG